MAAIAAAVVVATALLAVARRPRRGRPRRSSSTTSSRRPDPSVRSRSMGDSVMLGSVLETDGYGPSVAQMLVERGWGPVPAKAGVGFQAGGQPGHQPRRQHVDLGAAPCARGVGIRRTIVVSIGPNDIVGCSGSQAAPNSDITRAGRHHRRRPRDVVVADHDAEAERRRRVEPGADDRCRRRIRTCGCGTGRRPHAANGIPLAGDGFHLPTGAAYGARSMLMADDITGRLGASKRLGAPGTPPASTGRASEYLPVAARPGPRQPRAAGACGRRDVRSRSTCRSKIAARAPRRSASTSRPSDPSTPDSSPRTRAAARRRARRTSTSSPARSGPTTSSSASSADRKLCVFSSATADVLVDLQGAFVPSGGLRLDTAHADPTRRHPRDRAAPIHSSCRCLPGRPAWC